MGFRQVRNWSERFPLTKNVIRANAMHTSQRVPNSLERRANVKQFGKILLFALGFGLLAAALSLIPSRPAAASGSAPVTVVNTPLPVDVNSLPAVQAQQSGAWNVGINGNVQIGNSPASPVLVRNVENPARQPFQASGHCSLTNLLNCSADIAVPAGKLLVIETITLQFLVDTGLRGEASVVVTLNGSPQFHLLPVDFQATTTSGTDVLRGAHAVRLYADPGSKVTFAAEVTNIPVVGDFTATFSGYLVDCGSGTGTCPIP